MCTCTCKTLYKFWNSSKIFALTEVQCKSNEMSIMLATVIDPEWRFEKVWQSEGHSLEKINKFK